MLRAFYKHEYSKEKEEILALIPVYSTVFVLHFELSRLKKKDFTEIEYYQQTMQSLAIDAFP